MLDHKKMKQSIVDVFRNKTRQLGIGDIIFGDTQKMKAYPGIRVIIVSAEPADDQVIQNGKQVMWDYLLLFQCDYKGTEGEQSYDQGIEFGNKIYFELYEEKTNNTMFNNLCCDFGIDSIGYDTEAVNRGFIYRTTIAITMRIIENR